MNRPAFLAALGAAGAALALPASAALRSPAWTPTFKRGVELVVLPASATSWLWRRPDGSWTVSTTAKNVPGAKPVLYATTNAHGVLGVTILGTAETMRSVGVVEYNSASLALALGTP